ncbi:MAG: DMT family transporter [Bacteroidetes bacterium]|nr:DMT family transporter [Bacteroidota bacterium]
MQSKKTAIIYILISTLLFGASAPLAKLLLGAIQPVMLAALLYLGSGFGLLIYKLILHAFGRKAGREAGMKRGDFPWLIGSVLAGGVGAPVVLMFSLKSTPASTASLLLNFEGVATALIAGFAFHEAIGKRIWLAVALITTASIILSLNVTGSWGFSIGSLGILGACFLWGIDNNFTRNISLKNPLDIVIVKGIAAGSFSFVLALTVGNRLPGFHATLFSLALGLLSYGLSIVFFILAMRDLGSARTSAYFASAPFIGMAISYPS